MIYRLLMTLFVLVSCGQPTQISYDPAGGYKFSGLLYANTCSLGESFIVYENRQFHKGSKSIGQFDQIIVDISQDGYSSQMLSANGCQRVFAIDFNGEFEQETNILGNGGQEAQNVIQVYQFRIPPK
jgi:hypothetical protein